MILVEIDTGLGRIAHQTHNSGITRPPQRAAKAPTDTHGPQTLLRLRGLTSTTSSSSVSPGLLADPPSLLRHIAGRAHGCVQVCFVSEGQDFSSLMRGNIAVDCRACLSHFVGKGGGHTSGKRRGRAACRRTGTGPRELTRARSAPGVRFVGICIQSYNLGVHAKQDWQSCTEMHAHTLFCDKTLRGVSGITSVSSPWGSRLAILDGPLPPAARGWADLCAPGSPLRRL